MKFELGDSVLVIDEDFSGIVKNIVGNSVTIETKDGFLMSFEADELIIEKPKYEVQSDFFSNTDINSVISEKEVPKRKPQKHLKSKDRFEPTMEVDLHIHQLVKSSKHLSNFDMLTLQIDTAKRKLEYAILNRIQKVVFIHGVGEGVLKLELEYLFSRYSNIKFYDANYQKYGLGATEIYIFQNAPV